MNTPKCEHCGKPVAVETATNLMPRGGFLLHQDKNHRFCTMRCGFLWAVQRIESDKDYEETIRRRGL